MRQPQVPVPHFLDHAHELKTILKDYSIPRIWMFRNQATPKQWDEPYGLHVNYLSAFTQELDYIEERLGSVTYWCMHGHGQTWSEESLKRIEARCHRVCLDLVLPIYRVKTRTIRTAEGIVTDGVYKQIVYHPSYNHTPQLATLMQLLEKMKK